MLLKNKYQTSLKENKKKSVAFSEVKFLENYALIKIYERINLLD